MSKNFTSVVESSIDQVATLRGLTASYYQPHLDAAKNVIGQAVSEQVAKAVESIYSIADDNNLSESLVENALIEAGLVDAPEPEVEAEPETLEQKVDRLLVQSGNHGAAIASLIAAAKANGINPDNYAA